jgi:hypothetical protein
VGTAAALCSPFGLGVSPATGLLYLGDNGSFRLRTVNPYSAGGPAVATLAGSGVATQADGTGTAAGFAAPTSPCIDEARGLVYLGDTAGRLRRLTLAGAVVTTMAGTGVAGFADGLGAQALLGSPSGLACAASGSAWRPRSR